MSEEYYWGNEDFDEWQWLDDSEDLDENDFWEEE